LNLLTEKLPESVRVDGIDYPILTDFKNWIKFFEMIQSKELTDTEKSIVAMEWFIDKVPPNRLEALKALSEFFCMSVKSEKTEEKSKKTVLDFEHDAALIIAGFKQSYGIMLYESTMHWWQFKSLFDGMPDDTKIKECLGYRCLELNEIKDSEEKKRIRKIKKIYDLPQETMSDRDIGEAFDI